MVDEYNELSCPYNHSIFLVWRMLSHCHSQDHFRVTERKKGVNLDIIWGQKTSKLAAAATKGRRVLTCNLQNTQDIVPRLLLVNQGIPVSKERQQSCIKVFSQYRLNIFWVCGSSYLCVQYLLERGIYLYHVIRQADSSSLSRVFSACLAHNKNNKFGSAHNTFSSVKYQIK